MQLKNSVLMAAAGSGKTWGICNEVIEEIIKTEKKILIVTYTNKGVESIKKEYTKQNSGIIDKNVVIKTWFQFLLSDLVKPYQRTLLKDYNNIKSIDFEHEYGFINYFKRGQKKHYINNNCYIYSNTVSEFVIDCNQKNNGLVINRIEEVYSKIYIDEVQDLVGDDFEILNLLFESKIFIKCVGDYKQSTYTTYNSKKNKGKFGLNIINYFKELEKKKKLTLYYNNNSNRFNFEICKFSNSIFSDCKDLIESKINYSEENIGVYLVNEKNIDIYYRKYKPVVLKYDNKTTTGEYESLNFGQCKGMTFDRVIIYPNGPYKNFLKNKDVLKCPCKYYVSATRAKYSIAFVVNNIYENENFKYCTIDVGGSKIKVSKYV